ncbi:cell wall-binding repeat-containing protein [Zhihengliuella halotolerans]|uniref:cell wall-binding repeat-containing protein n=1 Tax=Zhihengliuella halotolerans TaxID=370736 RepID=UPI0013EEA484|nr:cell wall-binding repeat-containing protein [Zhihengliuella halotolerans]
MLTGLITGAVPASAAGVDFERIAGETRYETAVQASEQQYPAGAEIVYLATGQNYADALVAAPAAARHEAPLLLTRTDRLDSTTATEIERLNPTEIVIVGGPAAVSEEVARQAGKHSDQVTRLAGENRYETANKIVQTNFGYATRAFIATGTDFPDALSASAVAATRDAPVLLVKGTASTIPAETVSTLKSLQTSYVYVAGGTAAVSNDITTHLRNENIIPHRVAGKNRYETNVALNRLPSYYNSSWIYLATGANYPDALTAAAVAGSNRASLYLSKPDCLPNSTGNAINLSSVNKVTLAGGPAALSENVYDLLLCSRSGINDDLPKANQSVLTQLDSLEVKGRAPKTGYDRDEFGPAWHDVDGNGCRTRDDILRRDLYNITLGSTTGCPDKGVRAGTLDDPYTGETIDFVYGVGTSNAVHIDHVVALSDSWQKGAQQMTETHRLHFANDPINLLAVDGPANSAKGDSDAATWLPPNKTARCDYVTRQTAIKAQYGLWVTLAERDAIRGVISTQCSSQKAIAVTPVR